MKSDHDHPKVAVENESEFDMRLASNRAMMGCTSLPFGLLAFWIGWMTYSYTDGDDWFAFAARLLLSLFVLGISLFSLTMLYGAIFAPSQVWLESLFETTLRFLLFGVAFLIVLGILGFIGVIVFAWAEMM